MTVRSVLKIPITHCSRKRNHWSNSLIRPKRYKIRIIHWNKQLYKSQKHYNKFKRHFWTKPRDFRLNKNRRKLMMKKTLFRIIITRERSTINSMRKLRLSLTNCFKAKGIMSKKRMPRQLSWVIWLISTTQSIQLESKLR